MSNVTLFEGNPLANSKLFKDLQESEKNLLGGGGGDRLRISIMGGKFRKFQGSEQVAVSKDDTMNVVILSSAAVSRTYFEGEYSPDNVSAPHCWSADTKTPSPQVPDDQRMATNCNECPMNIKGSGQGDSRACRFSQSMAIALEDENFENVYAMKIPAASLFGKVEGKNMPMQAYARFLHAHNTPAVAVVTQMEFDENSTAPKLFFKATRPLTEEELEQVVELRDSPEAMDAITMTVNTSKDSPKALAAPKKVKAIVEDEEEEEEEVPAPKPKKQATVVVEEDEDDDDEDDAPPPKKAAKKKAAPPEAKDDDLGAIIGNWDDE